MTIGLLGTAECRKCGHAFHGAHKHDADGALCPEKDCKCVAAPCPWGEDGGYSVRPSEIRALSTGARKALADWQRRAGAVRDAPLSRVDVSCDVSASGELTILRWGETGEMRLRTDGAASVMRAVQGSGRAPAEKPAPVKRGKAAPVVAPVAAGPDPRDETIARLERELFAARLEAGALRAWALETARDVERHDDPGYQPTETWEERRAGLAAILSG